MSRSNLSLGRRSARSRGVATVEYSLLLVFVAIPTILGFTAGGYAMYQGYIRIRNHILLPTP